MIEVVSFARAKNGKPEVAEYLRELADMVDAGDVTDIVIVANNVSDNCYMRYANFDDRWKMLGAIEYAKDGVNHGG